MAAQHGLIFEAFPPEIRLMIYRLLLVNEDAAKEFDSIYEVNHCLVQPDCD